MRIFKSLFFALGLAASQNSNATNIVVAKETPWLDVWVENLAVRTICQETFDGLKFLGEKCWNEPYYTNTVNQLLGFYADVPEANHQNDTDMARSALTMFKVENGLVFMATIATNPGQLLITKSNLDEPVWKATFNASILRDNRGMNTDPSAQGSMRRTLIMEGYDLLNFELIDLIENENGSLIKVNHNGKTYTLKNGDNLDEKLVSPN